MLSSRNGHVGHDLNFSEDDPRPLFYVQDTMPSSTMVVLSFPTIQSQVRINLLQLHENHGNLSGINGWLWISPVPVPRKHQCWKFPSTQFDLWWTFTWSMIKKIIWWHEEIQQPNSSGRRISWSNGWLIFFWNLNYHFVMNNLKPQP